jgi:predicted lipoprotein with Yx(FWY)xxD motif
MALVSILSIGFAQQSGGMSGGGAGPVSLELSSDATLGEFLVDTAGMTLYLFTNDTENTSNCYDDCATAWPPLLTAGEVTAGEGVDASLLGTTERTDGTTQVTYGGWPLYYWMRDEAPGDITGQAVGDVWYVVSPQGEAVGEE